MRRIFCATFVIIFCFAVFASRANAEESFYVDPSYDWRDRTQITATLKKESKYAHWYFEDDYWNHLIFSDQNVAAKALDELSQEFDTKIYPETTNLFGDVWYPGIDNDPKITIVLTRLKEQAGGYFNTDDEHSRGEIPTSNEREMFFINARLITDKRINSFVTHELQHLITHYQKNILKELNDEVWINEMRSEVAPTILGYDENYPGSNLEQRVSAFLAQPSDSLIEWMNQGPDYAGANLFGQYLLDHYGKDIFREMIKSNSTGIASINDAFFRLGNNTSFPEVFTNWSIANIINDCGTFPKNTYCYLNPNLNYGNFHISFRNEYSAGERVTQVDSLKDWEAVWQEFTPGAGITKYVLELEFISYAKNSVFKVPYIATRSSGESDIGFLWLSQNETGTLSGKEYINGFGKDVSRVAVIPSNQTHNIPADVKPRSYTLTASLLAKRPLILLPSYPDGSLLRAMGEEKVYVIHKGYKRWLPTASIFEMYGHLKLGNVIDVTKEELDYYTESTLVRAYGDERVYEISNGQVKRWLNITGEEFSPSGRKWDSVFIINEKERNYYYPGQDIRI